MNALADKTGAALTSTFGEGAGDSEVHVIPPKRTRYLSEIADGIGQYNEWTEQQAAIAGRLQALRTAAGSHGFRRR